MSLIAITYVATLVDLSYYLISTDYSCIHNMQVIHVYLPIAAVPVYLCLILTRSVDQGRGLTTSLTHLIRRPANVEIWIVS